MGLTGAQLQNIQGDIWSQGFPKYHETYYFFTIKPDNEKIFAGCLKKLVEDPTPLISNLQKVKEDQKRIKSQTDQPGPVAGNSGAQGIGKPLLPVKNALIAFTSKGLNAIQAGLDPESLDLVRVQITDPAFYEGMASPGVTGRLHDTDPKHWEGVFQSHKIHGMLKVAGSTEAEVEEHLEAIQKTLMHGKVIEDVSGDGSRVVGWTRPNKHRGKEHFGFQDGISQPLMDGVDELDRNGPPNMNTDPSIIIVAKDTHHEGGVSRPKWMHDGSFVVFRKLEQDVEGFEKLTGRFEEFKCASKAHMGAKLVGRWPSGAPIVNFHTEDTEDPNKARLSNDFVYEGEICPVSAHIRKTNIRKVLSTNDQDSRTEHTKIIRHGIPYGSEYIGHENDKKETRGLLFACYQGSIEDAFEHTQSSWSNKEDFPYKNTGQDPIIGQASGGQLETELTDKAGVEVKKRVRFQQLVTLKGGEYFFAPSIKALQKDLSGVST